MSPVVLLQNQGRPVKIHLNAWKKSVSYPAGKYGFLVAESKLLPKFDALHIGICWEPNANEILLYYRVSTKTPAAPFFVGQAVKWFHLFDTGT